MPPKPIDIVRVFIAKPVIDRKDWVKYLVLVKWNEKIIREFVENALEAEFAKFLGGQVEAYVQGKEPPAEIAPAIMNLADDHLSGREISMRAGDYISLQKYFRKMRPA